jgi:homoserine O-acetyltransferase/O-succinyltransferase
MSSFIILVLECFFRHLLDPSRWGPLIGIGKAFDPSHYFIFCANVLGSPYGSASPVTLNPATNQPYGPEFPATTNRDDVRSVARFFHKKPILNPRRAHKLVLDHLGVTSVAVVVGGSMGGMATLEWPLCTPQGYTKHIIPLATSARHSAWCISWSEAQRQSIYADPLYLNGYYTPSAQPKNGLAAARMAAVLTYRSRDSFEGRFGRKPQLYATPGTTQTTSLLPPTPPRSPLDSSLAALAAHNEGNRNSTSTPLNSPATSTNGLTKSHPTAIFSAQSYLRYQGDKFTARFDANCYLHITRKLDTHDVARGRISSIEGGEDSEEALAQVLGTIPRGALVIGIDSDGLFTPSEQHELAAHIPGAELVIIQSKNGHDGFLLEFEEINRCVHPSRL